MRTTVDLSDEAYQAVKAIARDREESMGKVMSELIIKGACQPDSDQKVGEIRMVNGWPVVSIGRPITNQEVRDFLTDNE